MSINTNDLNSEREILVKDFEALQQRIKQVDAELIQMKSNLNAVHGAIQQVDQFIVELGEENPKEEEPKTKKEK